MAEAGDEYWKDSYEALNNLRILNKFNFEATAANITYFQKFIVAQILNLRSNNSKNALTLVAELFQNKFEEGTES
jgi:hypothetical protein